jgi:hypothetical protein
MHQHPSPFAPRLVKQVSGKLGRLPRAFATEHCTAARLPSTLLRTQSSVGNNIFNVLGDGMAVAPRRDLGALSNALGLIPFPEWMNSPSQAALYAPIDDPY